MIPISHKWGLDRLSQWHRYPIVMRGWPRQTDTKHMMQLTTRLMLLVGPIWTAGQTPVILARNGGCYQLQVNCVMWKDLTIHMNLSLMHQWVETQHQWYTMMALYTSLFWMRPYHLVSQWNTCSSTQIRLCHLVLLCSTTYLTGHSNLE